MCRTVTSLSHVREKVWRLQTFFNPAIFCMYLTHIRNLLFSGFRFSVSITFVFVSWFVLHFWFLTIRIDASDCEFDSLIQIFIIRHLAMNKSHTVYNHTGWNNVRLLKKLKARELIYIYFSRDKNNQNIVESNQGQLMAWMKFSLLAWISDANSEVGSHITNTIDFP